MNTVSRHTDAPGMLLRDSIKKFTRGLGKIKPPAHTFRWAHERISDGHPSILSEYFKVRRRSNIPQTRFIGSHLYHRVVLSEGANGKGHTWDQAHASGIMELAERFSCHRYLNNPLSYRLAPLRHLFDDHAVPKDLYSNFGSQQSNRVNLTNELLDARVRWYDIYDMEGNRRKIPMSVLCFLVLGSNGMASGNSREEALLHGISEVIERHCSTHILTRRLPTPTIDQTSITNPITKGLIRRFEALGHSILIKNFSFGLGIPVVAVVRKIDRTHAIVTVGVASNSDEALNRALPEN